MLLRHILRRPEHLKDCWCWGNGSAPGWWQAGEMKDSSVGCSWRMRCHMGSGGTGRSTSRQAAPVVMPAWWQGAEMLAPELSCVRVGETSTTPPAYPGCRELLLTCAESRKAVISSLLARISPILETLWGIHI